MTHDNRTTINADVPSMLKAALNMYDLGARQSGRTMRELKLVYAFLIKNETAKATYICPSSQKAKSAQAFWVSICRENVGHHLIDGRVEFCSIIPGGYALHEALSSHVRHSQKVFFDHTWLHEYYANMVDSALNDLVGTIQAFQVPEEPAATYRGPML